MDKDADDDDVVQGETDKRHVSSSPGVYVYYGYSSDCSGGAEATKAAVEDGRRAVAAGATANWQLVAAAAAAAAATTTAAVAGAGEQAGRQTDRQRDRRKERARCGGLRRF